MLNVLDLFSGIGGFSLGLERAGMKTVAFCEIDPYCRKVLKKHWPTVTCYEDIKELSGQKLWDDGNTVSIQVICGGFPCQDISVAGRGAGITGERSGLWSEYARIIGDLRPLYVIVENVSALLGRGLERVLGDLASLGYDTEWRCVEAASAGAPHVRDRIWVVAYSRSKGLERPQPIWDSLCGVERKTSAEFGNRSVHCGARWPKLSRYLRMGYGLPREVDEIRALGNAVVPHIVESMGKAIVKDYQKNFRNFRAES